MVDTAGTLTKAADLMIERGAKSVTCDLYPPNTYRVHAYEKRLEDSKLEELIVTDSIPTSQKESQKVKSIESCARFIC